MREINFYEISQLEFYSTDLNEDITIEWFLIKLLSTLWSEEECFSGKKPLENSSWKRDIEKALIQAGYIAGKVFTNGNIEVRESDVNLIMQEVIGRLGYDG